MYAIDKFDNMLNHRHDFQNVILSIMSNKIGNINTFKSKT